MPVRTQRHAKPLDELGTSAVRRVDCERDDRRGCEIGATMPIAPSAKPR
jgi:hypothetical protein